MSLLSLSVTALSNCAWQEIIQKPPRLRFWEHYSLASFSTENIWPKVQLCQYLFNPIRYSSLYEVHSHWNLLPQSQLSDWLKRGKLTITCSLFLIRWINCDKPSWCIVYITRTNTFKSALPVIPTADRMMLAAWWRLPCCSLLRDV